MNYQQWSNYDKLEFRVTSQPQPGSQSSKQIQISSLNRVGHYFAQWFALRNEPQVREIVADGRMQWRVYDPESDRTLQLNSPQEVSMWLEERYYNRAHNSIWD
ncbi:hypothetical protein [Gloeocapsopsis dulcis]|uniref:Uncharacterized protein n=1 Tax=Gloeocapsopsis dulcis AAB1 = 1H9 TaxID=1433147 RepID=A0A6N8FZ31_9CHRO|nr:hypothetical protein [Gloeocapsopsis dulcis]MUL38211.1 hypothetical protein [Gloeocapsopsis dulcis AAB1 = 1H9]WNN90305.1 hypothetical protein P0S91_04195 [Gloeocapsopsis dulcis]